MTKSNSNLDPSCIQYREPETIKELESLFLFRYAVYSQDPDLFKMVSANSKHDINWFDLNAFHFAAFENGNPIGYIRITNISETHFTKWVQEIISNNNIQINPKKSLFPFQDYCPDSNWSNGFIESLVGRKIGEVGKLAINSDHRKGGEILETLIESFIHYCKNDLNFQTGFGSCSLLLERYYRKFGFTRANGAVPFIHEELPLAIIVRFDKKDDYI